MKGRRVGGPRRSSLCLIAASGAEYREIKLRETNDDTVRKDTEHLEVIDTKANVT